jgi:hypothetical protein
VKGFRPCPILSAGGLDDVTVIGPGPVAAPVGT